MIPFEGALSVKELDEKSILVMKGQVQPQRSLKGILTQPILKLTQFFHYHHLIDECTISYWYSSSVIKFKRA